MKFTICISPVYCLFIYLQLQRPLPVKLSYSVVYKFVPSSQLFPSTRNVLLDKAHSDRENGDTWPSSYFGVLLLVLLELCHLRHFDLSCDE